MVVTGPALADERTNDWIEGFATATLVREFEIRPIEVQVHEGTLRGGGEASNDVQLDTVVRALLEIEGVAEVKVFLRGETVALTESGVCSRGGARRSIARGGSAS